MLTRTEAPAVDPIDADDVYDHLRLIMDGGSPELPVDADYVAFLISAAVSKFDGPEGLLARALISQKWKLTLDCFPAAIKLPLPPCISVESVLYNDANGDEQTLAASKYAVQGIGDPSGARIIPAYGKTWPSTWDFPGSVSINFTAGYGADPDDVPAALRMAIAQTAAHMYENREPVAVGVSVAPVPMTVSDTVAAYQFWSG